MSQIKLESLTLISSIGLTQKFCPILRKFNHFYYRTGDLFYFLDKHLQLWALWGLTKFVFILFLATTKSFFGSLAMHSRKLFHLFRVSKSTPFSREYIGSSSRNYNTDVKICTNVKNQTWIFIFDFSLFYVDSI